jgi:F-type H+-transporting ATPase subunit b
MRATLFSLTVIVLLAAPLASAAEDAHKEGLLTPFTDPVTHMVAASIIVFLAIAWRMGAFKALLGGIDARADKIANDLAEAANLREQAATALVAAERRSAEAEKEAEGVVARAKTDAARMMEEARKDMAEKLARREAQAVQRIARAEMEAESEVRRAAADAATAAARKILAADTSGDAFDRAANEIERTLRS